MTSLSTHKVPAPLRAGEGGFGISWFKGIPFCLRWDLNVEFQSPSWYGCAAAAPNLCYTHQVIRIFSQRMEICFPTRLFIGIWCLNPITPGFNYSCRSLACGWLQRAIQRLRFNSDLIQSEFSAAKSIKAKDTCEWRERGEHFSLCDHHGGGLG